MKQIMVDVSIGFLRRRPATKEALRDVLATFPANVWFAQATFVGPSAEEEFRGADIPEGVRLVLFGPDRYVRREWFATVVRQGDGSVLVS